MKGQGGVVGGLYEVHGLGRPGRDYLVQFVLVGPLVNAAGAFFRLTAESADCAESPSMGIRRRW